MTQESISYDIVIVGGGPSGLATAIHLKQLSQKYNHPVSICLLEKGAFVGAHILSGAVFDVTALDRLLPDWKTKHAPLHTQVKEDHFIFLTQSKAISLPVPPAMKNHNHYIISLGALCQWLAEEAKAMGVEIYPGFSGADFIFDELGSVCGVRTGEVGIDKNGHKTERYQEGMPIYAKHTILAEGCRGSLTERIIKHFDLRKECQPQTYAIGIKELWELDNKLYNPGLVMHTLGWPLDHQTYGGSFMYHLNNNQLAIGFVIGLDYKNPYLDPFEEFQRFKTHPHIKPFLAHGKRLGYGARALNEGGFQSIPKLTFPGGLLVGDAAGFLNVPQIKGSHNAIFSGMVAASTLFDALSTSSQDKELFTYTKQLSKEPFWQTLKRVRNIRPAFRFGLLPGLGYAALTTYIFKGLEPWTFKHNQDHLSLNKAKFSKAIMYPKPDHVVSFDKLSSVYLSNTMHEENQPCHLKVFDFKKNIEINYHEYASPETRYCPANVYEIIDIAAEKKLQINAQNCVHCKTCDIKDPLQNIKWTPPEGGGGPNYTNL